MDMKRRRVLAVMLAVAFLGCAQPPRRVVPSPVVSYATSLAAAQQRADSGDYSGADRILADYARRAGSTPEAREIAFWRALYMVDPANKTSSLSDGIRALDIYINTNSVSWYRPQAEVLRRMALTQQALRQAQSAAPRVNGRDTVFVSRENSREDEIAQLKDQLAKANAELERIKKRLANPSP